VLVAAAKDGKAGVQNLLRSILRWQVGVRWYLMALFVTLVAVLVIAIPFYGVIPLQMITTRWELFLTMFVPGVVLPFLHINLPEEIGWTSLQSRVQERHGPLRATIIVTPAFALFHLPAFFVAGWVSDDKLSLAQLPTALLTVGILATLGIFFRLLVLWLYNSTGRSLLIVGLFHSAYNMTNKQQFTSELVPGHDASWLPTLAIVIVAILVAAFTRGRFAYKETSA
jgi:membrane protease YdiL (CAAX protease family)